jgi:hypothetical protein
MIWGSSFFFTRMATQEFGPWSTAWMRVSVAAITLLPLVFWQHQAQAIKDEWRPLFGMGLFNSAVPFFCFAFALQSLSTGLSSILNATTPLFGALIAWLWLKDRPTRWRGLGLLLGFAGSAWLAVGMMSTGLAYVLYFRLIVKTGAARTMTLTYLIPLFANLIGVFVLDEIVTGTMLLAGVVILLGTAMASGLFPRQGLP